MRSRRRTTGQALVEFALAATLLFFLVAAAVDLGLLFFSLQAVRAAAQEGATYGRVPVQRLNADGTLRSVDLDYAQIIMRIRSAAGGAPRSVGVVNLYDLDNNGVDDVAEGIVPNPGTPASPRLVNGPVTQGPIRIDNPFARNPNAIGPFGSATLCSTTARPPAAGMRNAGQNCWIRVRIEYTYRFFFPLAPAFGPTVRFPVTYSIQIKSEFIG